MCGRREPASDVNTVPTRRLRTEIIFSDNSQSRFLSADKGRKRKSDSDLLITTDGNLSDRHFAVFVPPHFRDSVVIETFFRDKLHKEI